MHLFTSSTSNSRSRLNLLWIALTISLFHPVISISQKPQNPTRSDYFVHSLPGLSDADLPKMFAGHIETKPEDNANVFFWFFENKHIADKQRLVIWLNGGPGCSSEDGALIEVGPLRVRSGGKLEINHGAWNEFANLLFIDNPVGTGFSYANTDKYVKDLDEMANQMMTFLDKFFSIFPEYQHDDVYFAGESYAGQHIPYIAKHLLEKNKSRPSPINLKGLLLGNPWISGEYQYPAYLKYAYQQKLIEKGSSVSDELETMLTKCQSRLAGGSKNLIDDTYCEEILQKMLTLTSWMDGHTRMCHNMYDIRLTDTHSSCGMNWPPDLQDVTPYLRRADVKAALHIYKETEKGWQECNGNVAVALRNQHVAPSVQLLPDILAHVPIIIFSGDKDLICNHLGTEDMINNLEWNGGKGFELSKGVWAPRHQWTFDSEPAGLYQSARNLTYLLFYNSSHMVPFDLPRRSRDMLDRFMGVDVSLIGGDRAISLVDGEPAYPPTHPAAANESWANPAAGSEEITKAVHRAYKNSGEAILALVVIAASLWGIFVWRSRRRRSGYKGVWSGEDEDNMGEGLQLNGVKAKKPTDLEAARAFDERELDDLGGSDDDGIVGGESSGGHAQEPLRHQNV